MKAELEYIKRGVLEYNINDADSIIEFFEFYFYEYPISPAAGALYCGIRKFYHDAIGGKIPCLSTEDILYLKALETCPGIMISH